MAKYNLFSSQPSGALFNSLTAGSKIVGTVISDADFRIDGIIEGDVTCKGRIVVGDQARVNGDIACHSAEIHGAVVGAVKAEDTLSIHATGSIQGDVATQVLVVEPKAFFSGSCTMQRQEPVQLPTEEKQVEKSVEKPVEKPATAPVTKPAVPDMTIHVEDEPIPQPTPIVAAPIEEDIPVAVPVVEEAPQSTERIVVEAEPVLDFGAPADPKPIIIEQPITISTTSVVTDSPIIVEDPMMAAESVPVAATPTPINPVVVMNEPRPLEIVQIED